MATLKASHEDDSATPENYELLGIGATSEPPPPNLLVIRSVRTVTTHPKGAIVDRCQNPVPWAIKGSKSTMYEVSRELRLRSSSVMRACQRQPSRFPER